MSAPVYSDILKADADAFYKWSNFGVPALCHCWTPFRDGSMYSSVHKLMMVELSSLATATPIDWTLVGDFIDLEVKNSIRSAMVKATMDVEFPGMKPGLPKVCQTLNFVAAQVMNQIYTYVTAGQMGSTVAQQAAELAIVAQQAQQS